MNDSLPHWIQLHFYHSTEYIQHALFNTVPSPHLSSSIYSIYTQLAILTLVIT